MLKKDVREGLFISSALLLGKVASYLQINADKLMPFTVQRRPLIGCPTVYQSERDVLIWQNARPKAAPAARIAQQKSSALRRFRGRLIPLEDERKRRPSALNRQVDGNDFGHNIVSRLAMEFARTARLG